jgi:hypothetical protein
MPKSSGKFSFPAVGERLGIAQKGAVKDIKRKKERTPKEQRPTPDP